MRCMREENCAPGHAGPVPMEQTDHTVQSTARNRSLHPAHVSFGHSHAGHTPVDSLLPGLLALDYPSEPHPGTLDRHGGDLGWGALGLSGQAGQPHGGMDCRSLLVSIASPAAQAETSFAWLPVESQQ